MSEHNKRNCTIHDQWRFEDIKNDVQETYREKVAPAKILPSDLIIVTCSTFSFRASLLL